MAVKFTRLRVVSTRDLPTPGDPCDDFRKGAEECVQRFRSTPVTPQSALDLENQLDALAKEACRQLFEREVNRLEPDDRKEMPPKVVSTRKRIASTRRRRLPWRRDLAPSRCGRFFT